MNIREAVIQRIVQRTTRMRAALEAFNDTAAEQARVGPKWNVRDLAGHFVFWDGEIADLLPKLARGEAAPKYDFDRVNDETFRKYRRMSHVMLLPQLRAAEERLIAAVRAIDPKQLIDSPARELIEEGVIEHYDHHWRGLSKIANGE